MTQDDKAVANSAQALRSFISKSNQNAVQLLTAVPKDFIVSVEEDVSVVVPSLLDDKDEDLDGSGSGSGSGSDFLNETPY